MAKIKKPIPPDPRSFLTRTALEKLERPDVRLSPRAFALRDDKLVISREQLSKAVTAAGLKQPGLNAATEVEVSVKVKF